MRKNFETVGFYPQPVLIVGSYDADGVPDAMNVGWGGLVGSKYVEINISRGHKTTENIILKQAFTLSFADLPHLVEADFVGLVSGHDVPDKISQAGLHPVRGIFVEAPVFTEFPLALECRVASLTDGFGGVRIVGEVMNMSADESILDSNGLVDPDKAQFLSFDRIHRVYRTLSGVVGQAYHDGSKLIK